MKIPFFWDVMPHHWVTGSQHFKTAYWSENFRNRLPSDMASYSRRMESSATLLHKPQTSQSSTIHTQHYHGFHQLRM